MLYSMKTISFRFQICLQIPYQTIGRDIMNISEIARLAGVSPAAVSRYFNGGSISEEKRQAIKKVIEATGYAPNLAARSLRQQRSDNIGVIVPKLNSDSVSSLVDGISSVLNRAGFMAVLGNAESDENRELEYLRLMQESRLSGIILMATVLTPKHIRLFRDTRTPIVICGQSHPSVTGIYHDDRCAAREIARYMIARGRRRLAYVGAIETDESAGVNRRIGVEEAMIEACISPSELIRSQGPFTVEEGYRGMTEILDSGYVPDGVICAADILAFGAMKALRERGFSIPNDVSIGGIDGSPAGTIVTPALTSVRLYHRECGERAAETLLSMIRHDRLHPESPLPVTHTMLGYTLVERESV